MSKTPYLETQNIIRESLSEVRALSKSLNRDAIQKRGFILSLETEIDRLNRMKLIDAELLIKEGDVKFENKKDALILFRILQEFISNSIKHAQATTLKIVLTYTADH